MKLSEHFVIRTIADETIAVPLVRNLKDDAYIISLNTTAKQILDGIKTGADRKKILSSMKTTFPEIKESVLQNDLDDCLKELSEAGLIEG